MTRQRDIVIIGAGLAGTSAALQTSRVGLNVIALTKPNDPGYWARVKNIAQIPGLPDPTSGREVMDLIKKGAGKHEAAFQEFEARSIETTDRRTFKVCDSNNDHYEAPVIIIATGVSKDEHFLPGERELVGRGAYYSVANEAHLLTHTSATVIGKSKEAALAVLYLARFVEKIYFVIPSSKLDVPENILKDLEASRNIEPFFSSSIKNFNGTEELHSVTILSAGAERELKTSAAFIYTYNLKSCTDFLKGVVDRDAESGRLLVNSDFQTSRPGIFACGDVLAGELQNPAVTVAQGVIAAMNAEKFLRS